MDRSLPSRAYPHWMGRRHALVAFLVIGSISLAACDLRLRSGTPPERPAETDDESATIPATVPNVEIVQNTSKLPPSSVADVINRALPSVVNVRVTALQEGLFGVEEGKGQGSGVIIDEKGLIVTNNHVVHNATEVTIVSTDGKRFDGVVVGTDPERDLALIKVDSDELSAIEFGRSSSLRLGDEVIAIGFPLGLGGPTVTKGIVSAQGRQISVGAGPQTQELSGLIQTDAAINPGNSGGALVDRAGRLVGINTAAAGASFAENIGFAINIDSAIAVIKQILSEPPEKRAWLGVSTEILTPPVAAELDIDPDTEGLLVYVVVPNSPAEDVGIEQGDVITAIDGEEMTTPDALFDFLTDLEPGDKVEVTIVDEFGEDTVEVELGFRPESFQN